MARGMHESRINTVRKSLHACFDTRSHVIARSTTYKVGSAVD